MNEKETEKLNNLPGSESPERESLKGISYEEFKKISEEILKEYRENPGKVDINCDPRVIEKIIEFFPEEIKGLCQEILGKDRPFKDKLSLLKGVNKKDLQTLKETTENLIKTIREEFKEQIEKDFPEGRNPDLVKHLWMTSLHTLFNFIELIIEEREK